MKKNKPLLYDPLIINRVKQYLEENVDKTYLDVGVMTKHLQDRYPEYSRRKIAPFRALVEQAYRIVSQSYGMESLPTSGDDSGGSDLEVMDESSSNNIMNSIMNNLYVKPKGNASGMKHDVAAEAIDISSDESGDDVAGTNAKKSPLKGSTGDVDPKDASSKTSSSTSTTADVAAAQTNQGGQKRQESASAPHPSKKRKLQNSDKSELNSAAPMMAPMHRIPNYNHNSNESGQFAALSTPRPRKFKKEVQIRKSREAFQDIGGMESTLKELCELLMHIKSPDIYFVLGLMPPRGILLHGPPGCGKTLLAHAIAGQLNLPLIEIPATELIAGVSGESEERIRDIFEQAVIYSPCALFIDEIDAISSNRSYAQKDMERRIVSQLISSMDSLKQTEDGQSVVVIGATTRPDVLDPALRRVGRFDHEIAIGIPSRKDRKDILTIICDGLSVEPKLDYDKIAELTPGYVGADLLALVSRAATIAVKRKCSEQMRAFHAKAQSNITIVDLDDDDCDEGAKSGKPADATESTSKEAANTINDVNGSANTIEMKETTAPIQLGNGDVSEVTGLAETGNAVDHTSVEKSKVPEGKEPMEVDNCETEIVNEKQDSVEEKVPEKQDAVQEKVPNELPTNLPEPSLFELLNWLDNPPEDITLVADVSITIDDFCEAVKLVQPSAKREGFITVPDVTWDDIGSLQDIREELQLAVLSPVKYPEKLERLGLSAPSGVLLCGPPGCGKTLLAKAIANEAGINFISVKGPELMNMYVGESERAVRACFQRARNSAPCVIFFDEFDSLCPKRSDGNEASSGTRVVNQLLTEMDGVEERKGVYILAATNRPDIIDPAILRPGRLDTILYVGLPQEQDRIEILKATTKNGKRPVLAGDVDFTDLASKTEGYTGADLAGLVKQAAMLALKESNKSDAIADDDLCVRPKHFELALKLLRPSVNAQDRKVYDKLRLKYAAPRLTPVEEKERSSVE